MKKIFRPLVPLTVATLLAACTMKNQEAPPLTGPSEYGTSVGVQVSPDVLEQNGASQSVVTVTVRDAAGQVQRNVSLRADIIVNGQVVDFGSLSSRTVVTGNDGRASLIYTAPGSAGESEAVVDIVMTPIGTNFANATSHAASIRLVPPGIRVPPSDLVPAFVVSPATATEHQSVLFDASTSQGTIAQYRWDFGDGSSGSGSTATHAFSAPGTYFVRLTLVDPIGRTASTTRSVTVGQGTAPVARFTASPTDPKVGDVIHFNAAQSTAAAGRRIVSYAWSFGDGQTASGVEVSHRFFTARTYTITLTVTDDIGRTHAITVELEVAVD